ncbi:LytR/AlgR family response regulator transcription factor [Loigolactobacillus coryniformis]|uniref:Response regulator transcription factor n=1 Tax=Loigolactobacillus coryniformis TaxID=1610 RepID=A0A5B8TIT6_9LACO|nr:LytTR family DNA-binding domain-containing protein [Loigolactobacillus coryniformis]QEA53066.1 response regulator transcription factor [Loigolactobacillus coryniformis]
MRIAIVEDNQQEQNSLLTLLNKYAIENNIAIEPTIFNNGLQIVDQYHSNFDVIYFDVQMPLMDGMTAAKKIRQIDDNVIIVFLTNYVQWAVEGYSVHALDFLLKPLTYFNFQEHFKKIRHQLAKHQKTLTLKSSNGLRKIILDNLYYVESEGHYLHFHTIDGTIDILDTMKNIECELKPDHFYRCNNGYLVNLGHVKAINGNIAEVGPDKLQISRPRKKAFMAALTDYLGSEMI